MGMYGIGGGGMGMGYPYGMLATNPYAYSGLVSFGSVPIWNDVALVQAMILAAYH
jgi:hypothetical protein